MGELDAAQLLDNWQQQLEEITALQAICGDDVTVLAEGFASGEDAAAPRDDLAATPPAEPLECQAAVHVEVPQEGLTMEVGLVRSNAIRPQQHAQELAKTSTKLQESQIDGILAHTDGRA